MPTTLPLRYPIDIYTGTTFRREFRWLPDGKSPQDFTGWRARARLGTIGKRLAELTTENGMIRLGKDGSIVVHVNPEQTETLNVGTYYYVLDLIDPHAMVQRFLRGRCQVIRDDTP